MKAQFFFILLCGIIAGCNTSSKYPNTLSDIREELRPVVKDIWYHSGLPIDEKNEKFLDSNCTTKDLYQFLEFQSPTVRVVAFYMLYDRKDSGCYNMVLKHLNDTSLVYRAGTCFLGEYYAGDLMLERFILNRQKYVLSRQEKDTLIDRILKNHTYLNTTNQILEDIPPQEKYYTIIKNQLVWSKGGTSIIALAKFKKEKDVALLKYFMQQQQDWQWQEAQIFRAIEEFPHKDFFGILESHFTNHIKKSEFLDDYAVLNFANAVAVYQTPQSIDLLNELYKSETYINQDRLHDYRMVLFKAIYKYNCPLYSKLYNQLKAEADDFILENPIHKEYVYW